MLGLGWVELEFGFWQNRIFIICKYGQDLDLPLNFKIPKSQINSDYVSTYSTIGPFDTLNVPILGEKTVKRSKEL